MMIKEINQHAKNISVAQKIRNNLFQKIESLRKELEACKQKVKISTNKITDEEALYLAKNIYNVGLTVEDIDSIVGMALELKKFISSPTSEHMEIVKKYTENGSKFLKKNNVVEQKIKEPVEQRIESDNA